jgi:hypothetical protein
VTRIPPPDGDDEAAVDAYISAQLLAAANGELLEELPWDEVAGMDEVFDELGVEWALEEHAAAMVQRRRDRRRRRAWGWKRDQG